MHTKEKFKNGQYYIVNKKEWCSASKYLDYLVNGDKLLRFLVEYVEFRKPHARGRKKQKLDESSQESIFLLLLDEADEDIEEEKDVLEDIQEDNLEEEGVFINQQNEWEL